RPFQRAARATVPPQPAADNRKGTAFFCAPGFDLLQNSFSWTGKPVVPGVRICCWKLLSFVGPTTGRHLGDTTSLFMVSSATCRGANRTEVI
ncbi:MAG: hypothetical protein WD229_13750, partial [Pirellulales bacterium]